MQALVFCDDADLQSTIPLCHTYKRGIEIQSFYDPQLLHQIPEAVEIHRQALESIELRAMHGPFADLCPGSFDPLVAQVARQRFDWAAAIAAQFNISHLILHHGYVPGTSEIGNWIRRCTRFWREFLNTLPDTLVMHLENMLEREPAFLADVITAIDRPNINICLDIGHVHCHSAIPLLTWIESLGPHIGYVHLHDNHGETDEHLGLGQGTIPLDEMCQALQHYAPTAVWALETQVSNMETSLHWLEEHGFLDSASCQPPISGCFHNRVKTA